MAFYSIMLLSIFSVISGINDCYAEGPDQYIHTLELPPVGSTQHHSLCEDAITTGVHEIPLRIVETNNDGDGNHYFLRFPGEADVHSIAMDFQRSLLRSSDSGVIPIQVKQEGSGPSMILLDPSRGNHVRLRNTEFIVPVEGLPDDSTAFLALSSDYRAEELVWSLVVRSSPSDLFQRIRLGATPFGNDLEQTLDEFRLGNLSVVGPLPGRTDFSIVLERHTGPNLYEISLGVLTELRNGLPSVLRWSGSGQLLSHDRISSGGVQKNFFNGFISGAPTSAQTVSEENRLYLSAFFRTRDSDFLGRRQMSPDCVTLGDLQQAPHSNSIDFMRFRVAPAEREDAGMIKSREIPMPVNHRILHVDANGVYTIKDLQSGPALFFFRFSETGLLESRPNQMMVLPQAIDSSPSAAEVPIFVIHSKTGRIIPLSLPESVSRDIQTYSNWMGFLSKSQNVFFILWFNGKTWNGLRYRIPVEPNSELNHFYLDRIYRNFYHSPQLGLQQIALLGDDQLLVVPTWEASHNHIFSSVFPLYKEVRGESP